ncbi:MAG: 4'-phosphopantetheinyl transferase superfamily protein [Ichthyobacteriaceae bacterium]|nr:4'-phosphopantetheinyl transferase superfamily protein [Ichthyobacteriaceae bacterium]
MIDLREIIVNSSTKLFYIEIITDLNMLYNSIVLSDESKIRLNSFSSDKRKLEFLNTRFLLKKAGYNDSDLKYKQNGAPFLKNAFISISHSKNYVAIILGDKKVGIDIELQRNQIFKIAHKFINEEEKKKFDTTLLQTLTIIWNAKEAMFKWCSKQNIDFRKNLNVTKIDLENSVIESEIIFDNQKIKLHGAIIILKNNISENNIEDNIMVYIME